MVLLLTGGMYHPVICACLGMVVLMGRVVHVVGSTENEARGRHVGTAMSTGSCLGLFCMSMISIY